MKIHSNLKHLFVSRTRLKLLQIFFYQPQNYFYVRQLVRLSGEEINSVRRELQNLKSASILLSESRANKLYYWANPDSPFFSPLLTLACQSVGLGHDLYSSRDRLKSLKLLLYSYSFAIGQPSSVNGIDLIIVGDLLPKDVASFITTEEERRQREINYMIMPRSEYRLRRQKRDPFLVDFFLNRPLLIIGSFKELIGE